MNLEMNGKPISTIWFPNGDSLGRNGSEKMVLSATYHGDREEFWVVCKIGDRETRRFNCRHLASIDWD